EALAQGVDVVGLARALVLEPELPNAWLDGDARSPVFPRFQDPPAGGVTAWYTMRLTELAEGRDLSGPEKLPDAIAAYNARDNERVALWNERFSN
ncbi:MAG: oxidoreductase, partial [Pseudomonadota bacterium]